MRKEDGNPMELKQFVVENQKEIGIIWKRRNVQK